jgi:lysyl-tRNA synthetase class 2
MPSDDLFAERRRKVDELAARGIPSYGVDFAPSATMDEARRQLNAYEAEHAGADVDAPDRPVVAVAGRIMQLRDLGGAAFAHVEDSTGRLQMWFRADRPGDAHAMVGLLDLGDIVGITGPMTRTRRGEPTVLVDTVTLLVKALHAPPEKFHGLQDQETRYRKRYLDLLSNASQRRHFETRTRLLRALRATLDDRGFLEVETPILQPIPGGGHALPFETHWNALHTDVYLRIAIELHLKRLIVGGYARVYEIGRVFRNEGLSPRHNPEFTMLEAYQAYATYDDMRELTESLITAAADAAGPQVAEEEEGGSAPSGNPLLRTAFGRSLDLTPPYRTATMVDLVLEHTGVDARASWDGMHAEAARIGVEVPRDAGPGAVLLEIYEQRVESELWDPTFVLDYPAEVSPLARRRRDDPRFVERFELIVAGRELANAFSELNDPIDQRARFEEQARLRAAGDSEIPPIDEDFLEAIEVGMPPAGGLGIGVDRLVMLLTDSATIRDVLLFPTMRPQPRGGDS